MKKIILTSALALSVCFIFAQYRYNFNTNNIRDNDLINLSILGDASITSLNYERLFLNTSNFFLAAEFGLGIAYTSQWTLSIPHHITANLGINKHFLEFGAGGTFIRNPKQNYFSYAIIGYRLQPLDSDKIYFRLYGNFTYPGFNTSLPFLNSHFLFIPYGISIGISI